MLIQPFSDKLCYLRSSPLITSYSDVFLFDRINFQDSSGTRRPMIELSPYASRNAYIPSFYFAVSVVN